MAFNSDSENKEHVVLFNDGFSSEPMLSNGEDHGAVHVPNDPTLTDWAIPALFSFFYCCCSAGCCAVYYAFRANYNHDKGNLVAARKHTKRAKMMTILTICLGIPLTITFVVLTIMYLLFLRNTLAQIAQASQPHSPYVVQATPNH